MDTETSNSAAAKPKKSKAKKKKAVKRAGSKKSKTKPRAKARKKAAPVGFVRLDLRVSKSVKAKLAAKAVKLRRTITSVIIELIEKMPK